MSKEHKWLDLQPYLRREPITLALLTGLAIVLFAAVTGIARLYQAQEDALAERWSSRGADDLKAANYAAAVVDFRTSLLYARDDYSYQLNLALALVGENRFDEAEAYLENLWELQPENGLVNLELARVAVARKQAGRAIRYYNNAIYAVWPGGQDAERRATRLEFINYLLRTDAKAQADSQLIAMAGNLNDDPKQHEQAGQLFLQAQDYQRALDQFRLALRRDRRNQEALAGAGDAAFKLGEYAQAEHYLEAAVDNGDKTEESQLRIARLVIEMDPFRQQISTADRDRIALDAFGAAGARLQACTAPGPFNVPAATLVSLTQDWTSLKPQMTEQQLRRNPDLASTAMQLVFDIEHQTSGLCGSSTDTDNALLLISNMHQGM
ncbi:MAG TPA: tetratricopeptide repeat protein [Terracidiphilus sp.]|nr:tetratricopeptide repeat protein [Terracidiphilus sp.]